MPLQGQQGHCDMRCLYTTASCAASAAAAVSQPAAGCLSVTAADDDQRNVGSRLHLRRSLAAALCCCQQSSQTCSGEGTEYSGSKPGRAVADLADQPHEVAQLAIGQFSWYCL